jgi:hypothetical protein
MSGEDKFAKFRNRYRRVYGFQRLPPDERPFIDPLTNQTSSVDLTRFLRDRDYFVIDKIFEVSAVGPIGYPFAEYEEDLIYLNYESLKTVNFSTPFTSTPIVTLDIWPDGENTDFIVPFILSVTNAAMVIGVSAETSGVLRYKAIYNGGSYPAQVTRSPLFPSVTTIAAAGSQPITNQNIISLPFTEYQTANPGILPEFSVTAQDIGDKQVDVHISQDSVAMSGSDIHLSSDFTGYINYIALKP